MVRYLATINNNARYLKLCLKGWDVAVYINIIFNEYKCWENLGARCWVLGPPGPLGLMEL